MHNVYVSENKTVMIRVRPATRERLDRARIVRRETYDEVINRGQDSLEEQQREGAERAGGERRAS